MKIKIFFLSMALCSIMACKVQKKLIVLPDGVVYHLAFSDEFNGADLDKKTWVYRTDSKYGSTQLPANVSVSKGYLHLAVKKEQAGGKGYTGSGIISSRQFGFGYYEASFRIPSGAGWHNSFWLMSHDGSGGTGPSVSALELDICENDSKNKTDYSVNVHRWRNKHIMIGGKKIKTSDLSTNFHRFGCEYTEKQVKYYFDGELVQTIDTSQLPNGDMNIWLTTIASNHGEHMIDDSLLPNSLEYDYVRYYKSAK